MEHYFVLDENGEPQHEPDHDKWERWFESASRGVARTAVSPSVTVLTMFRGVDQTEAAGEAPKLFETRVFGGTLDGEEASHNTRAEALAAHSALVEWCRVAIAPDHGVDERMIA